MDLLGGGTADLGVLRDFVIALLIGALIGVERERKLERDPNQFGGLRTFILVAESGALTVVVGRAIGTPWLFVAGLVGVTLLVGAAYLQEGRHHQDVPGMTGEFAAIVTYLLGGAVFEGMRGPAVMLAIATSALLTFKRDLHKMVRGMTRDEVVAGLKLLFASFIVLPLLPDHSIDPWDALNPYTLWLLVVLISALSLVGYIAVRWLGEKRGLALTGLFGGLVSSTAVTLTFARRSKEESARPDGLGLGLMLAWAIMLVRMVVLVLVVDRSLIEPLILPITAMLIVNLAYALVLARRRGAPSLEGDEEAAAAAVPLQNPFSLMAAIQFAVVFAVILVGVALARTYLPPHWLYAVAALAGTTNVDAITLSMAGQASHAVEPNVAAFAILLAGMSNNVVKTIICAAAGSRRLARTVFVGGTAIGVTGLAAWGVHLWIG